MAPWFIQILYWYVLLLDWAVFNEMVLALFLGLVSKVLAQSEQWPIHYESSGKWRKDEAKPLMGESAFFHSVIWHCWLEHSICKSDLCNLHPDVLFWSKFLNKKHLKNVGPIRYCEPPLHCQSPDVASRMPAIAIAQAACDIHNDNDDEMTMRDRRDRYGPMEWAQWNWKGNWLTHVYLQHVH